RPGPASARLRRRRSRRVCSDATGISMSEHAPLSLAVTWSDPQWQASAEALAERLQLPVLAESAADAALLLELAEGGLALRSTEAGAPGAVRVDFVGGALAHRRQFGGGAGQM